MIIILQLIYSFNGTISNPRSNFSTTLNMTYSDNFKELLLSNIKCFTYENNVLITKYIKLDKFTEVISSYKNLPELYPTNFQDFELISVENSTKTYQLITPYPNNRRKHETLITINEIPHSYEITGLDPISYSSFDNFLISYTSFTFAARPEFCDSMPKIPETNSSKTYQNQLFCDSAAHQAIAFTLAFHAKKLFNQTVPYSAQALLSCSQHGCQNGSILAILGEIMANKGLLPVGPAYLSVESVCEKSDFTGRQGVLKQYSEVSLDAVSEMVQKEQILVEFCAAEDFLFYRSGVIEVGENCFQKRAGVIVGQGNGFYNVKVFLGSEFGQYQNFKMSKNSKFTAVRVQLRLNKQNFNENVVVLSALTVSLTIVSLTIGIYFYLSRQKEILLRKIEDEKLLEDCDLACYGEN